MSKSDWNEAEVRRDENETPVKEKTPCEMYGHSWETVTDENDVPIIVDGEKLMRCNDCGNTYEE